MVLYIVSSWSVNRSEQTESLVIGCVTTSKEVAEAFVADPESQPVNGRYNWKVNVVEDGERHPDIG